MSENDYLKLKGVEHIGQKQLLNMIEINLKAWLDWCFLRIGGWNSVAISDGDVYGGDKSLLRPVNDAEFGSSTTTTTSKVWEGIKKDWVYETNVDYVDYSSVTRNPTPVGTPQVNGSDTGDTYYIDYPNGRVVFSTAISKTSTVKIAHSYRTIQVYRADDVPWFTELQSRTYNSTRYNDNDYKIGAHIRRQMPCIIIEAVNRGDSQGVELGSGAQDRRQDILFHILAETRNQRNDMIDYCANQSDKEIWLYNINTVAAAEENSLDYRGELVNSNTYPDFVAEDGYRWRRCFMENTITSSITTAHPELYIGIVKTRCKVRVGST